MRLLGWCVMPNHWHLLAWPREDGALGRFMQRLTVTHARRWQEHTRRVGEGHVYQGRYKSFPVQSDEHFLTVLRYVERNALRAGLVDRAEDWRWGSLWSWANRRKAREDGMPELAASPVDRPRNWVWRVKHRLRRVVVGLDAEAEFAELGVFDGGGGLGEQVAAVLGFGEGDDVADVGGARQVHDDAGRCRRRSRRGAGRRRKGRRAGSRTWPGLLPSSMPRTSKTRCCTSGRWIRIEPPPSSLPLTTRS